MNLVSLLFGFSGRINRVQYWLGCIIAGVGGAMLLFTLAALTLPTGSLPKSDAAMLQTLSSMSFAFGVPFLLMGWAGAALQTKRFHDRGRSGLWALAPLVPVLMIVVNIVGGLASGARPEQVVASIMMWLMLLQVINLVMFVDIGCMPGRPEANRYGNPPGGGFGGGNPAPTGGAPIPGRTKQAPQSIPGMGSTLASAESAIERAIAAQGKLQARQPAAAPRATSTPAPSPAAGFRPASASGSFGRKAPS